MVKHQLMPKSMFKTITIKNLEIRNVLEKLTRTANSQLNTILKKARA